MATFRAGQILTASALNNIVLDLERLIDEIELASAAANVEFTGISQDYRHLMLVTSGGITDTEGGSAVRSVNLRFNSDTASQYEYFYFGRAGDGTFVENVNQDGGSIVWGRWGTQTHTSLTTLWIYDYTAARFKKTRSIYSGSYGDVDANWEQGNSAGTFFQSDAIQSIAMFQPFGESFQAGSVFSLYGLR